ncbi:hypothetical protein BLNAU_1709 [Blattamonas nauphoetae]|uniref:Dynein heavy chain n=1 Tax=Blattamonas nauphoetae TaxID=2049346 RepID=A0ABQ9YHD6_9EUKA|nr:hypothetical protein BLNAU_1709 [Blattamonas nauphoetae]
MLTRPRKISGLLWPKDPDKMLHIVCRILGKPNTIQFFPLMKDTLGQDITIFLTDPNVTMITFLSFSGSPHIYTTIYSPLFEIPDIPQNTGRYRRVVVEKSQIRTTNRRSDSTVFSFISESGGILASCLIPDTTPTQEELYAKFSKFIDQFSERDEAILNQESFRGLSNTITLRINQLQAFISLASTLQTTNSQTYSESQKKAVLSQTLLQEYRIKHPVLRRLYSLVKAFKAHPSSSFPRTLSEIHALVRIMTSAVHITTTLLVCATLYQFFSIVVHKASQYLCDTFTQLLTLQYFPIVNLTALRQTLNSIKTLYTRTLSILTGIEDITPPYLNRAVQPLTEFLRKLNVITQLHKLSGCMLQLTNLFSSPSLHIYGGFFTIVKSRFSQLMMSLTRTTTEKQSFRFSSIFTALTQQKIEKTSQIVSRIVIDVATLLPDIIRSNLPLYMIQSAFIIYLHFLQLFPQAQRTVLNQLNKDDFSRLLTTAIFRKHVDFILIQTGCTKDQAMFSKTILPLMSTRMILVRNIGMFILYQIFSENEVKESRLNSKIQHNFEGLSQLIAEGEEIRRNIEGKLEEQMKFFVAKLNKFSATLVDTPCFIQSEGEGIESTEVTLHNMPEFSAELRFSTSVHQTAFIPTMSSVHSHISITETHHVLSWVLQIMKNTLNTLPSDTLQITQAWVKKCQDVVHYGSQNVTWTSEFLPSYCEELLQTYSQLEHTLSVFDSTHNKFLSGMESSISRLHFSFPVEPYTIVQLKNTIRPFSAEFNGVFEQLKKTYSDQAKALLGTLTRDSTFGEQNESKQKLFHFLITRMENVFDGEKIRVFSDVLESILARIVEGPLISIPLFLDDGDLSYSASPLSLFSNPFSFNQQGTQIPHHIILSHQLGDPKTENARESVENLAIISIFDGFIHLFEPKHLTEVIQSKIQNLSMQTLETEKLCRHYYADISRYAPFWSISAQDLFSSFNTSSIGRGGQQSDSGTFIKRLSAKRLVDHLRKISQNTGKDNNSSPLIAGQAPAVFEIDDLVGTFSITEDESEELTIPEIEPSLLLSLENSRLFDPLDLRHQLVADLSEELLHDFDFPETTTMRNLLSFSLKGTDSDTYNPPLKLWKDYIDFIRYFIQSVNNLPPPPETPLGKIDITQLKEALVKLSQQWLHPFTSFVFFGLIVRMRLIMIYLTNITSIVRAHSTKEDNAESVAQFVHLRNSFSFIFSVNETFKLMKQRIDILATLNPSQATILMTEFDRTKKIRQKFDEQDWYAAFDSVHLTERNIAKHLFDVSERLDEQLNSLIITFNNKELAPITLEVTAPKAKQMLAAIRIPVDEVADFIALSQASDQEPNPYIIERFNDLKQMKENLLSLWNLWERFETHVSSLKDMKWGELHSKITNDLKDEWKFLLDVYMDQVHALRPALQSKPVFKSIFQFVSQHHRIWAMIYTLATTPIYDWHWAAVMRAITPQFAVNDDVNAMKMGTMPIRHLFELCNECKDIEQLNSTIKSIQKDDEHYQKLQNLESTWAEAQIPLILTQAEKDSLVLAPTRTSDSKSRRHDKKRRVLLPFPVVNISQCSELAAATMQDLQEINKLNTNEIHPETVKKLKHLEDLLYSIQSFLLTLHDSHTLNEKLTTALTVNVLSTTQAMKKTITSFTHVGDALRKLSSFLDSELSNVDTQLSKVNVQASQLLNERTHDHLAFVSKSIPHLLLLSYSQLVDYIRLFDSPSVHLPSSLLTKMIAHVESVTFTQQEVSPSTSMVGKGNDTHQHNDKDAIITPVMITSTSGEALVFLGESGIKKTEFFRLHLHLVTKISDTLRNEMNVLQQTFMSKANVFSWFLQIVPQFTNQSSFPINPQILFICLDSFLNTQLNLIINPSTPHTDWSVFEHVGSLQGFIIFSTSYLIALLRCPAPLTTYSQFTVSLIVMFLDLYDNLKQLLDHHTVLLRNPMAQNHHSSSVTSFASLFDQITQTVLAFPQTPVEQQVDTSVNHQLFRDILSSLLSLLSIYAHRVAFHVQLISSTYQAVSLIPGNPYIQQKLVPQHYYLSVGKRLSNPIYTIFNLSTYLPWIPYSRDVFFLPFSEQVRLNEMTQVASIPQPHQTLSQAGPLFVVNRTETDYIYSHIHSFAHTYNKNLHVLHLAPNTSPLEIKRAIVYTLASSLWLLLDGIEVLPPATQQTMVDWCLSVRSWFQTIPTNQSGIVTMTLENVSVSVSLPADPWCVFGIYRTVENFHGKINDWVENCFTVISLSKIVRNGLIGSLLQSNGFIFFDELDTKIQTYFKSLSDRLPNHFDIKDTDIYDYFTSLSHLRQFTKKCGQRLHEVLLNAPYVLSQASLPLIQLNSLFASSFLAIHTLKSSTQETETLRLLEEMAVKQVMLDEIVSLDSSLELLAMYSYKATILPRMKVEQTQADLSFESSLERIVHSLFSHPSTLTTLPVFVNSTDQSSVALQQSDVVRVHSMSTSIHHDPPVLPSSRPFHSFLLKSFEETYDTPIVHINGKHGIGKTNLIALHQTLYCKLHGFPPFIIPVNAPRTVPTDSRLMFLEKDSETNLFRRIQKTFSRLGVINETGRQDSVSDMDIPVWIVISVISTPKLRFGAFLEECFQCTAHISYGRIEISFTNGQSFLLPRHSKIFIETRSSFLNYRGLLLQEPKLLSVYHPIYPLIQWKLDRWARNARTLIDSDVLDVGLVILRVALTKTSLLTELTEFGSTHSAEYVISSTGLIDSTTVLLTSLIRIDQKRYKRPIDGSLLRTYIVYAICWTIVGHVPSTAPLMSDYLDWLDDWRMKVPSVNDTPLDHIRQEMNKKHNLLSLQGASTIVPKKNFNHIQQFEDFIKKTFLSASERFETSIWHYAPDPVEKILLPLEKIPPEHCLFTFDFQSHANIIDHQHHLYYLSYVTPFLALLLEGRDVILIDNFPTPTRNFAFCVLEAMSYQTVPHKSNRHLFTQDQYMFFSRFSWQHVPFSSINKTVSLPNGTVQLTSKSDVQDHLQVNSLINDLSREDHSDPKSVVKPPKDVIRLYEQQVPRRPSVWVVDEIDLATIPELINAVNHSTVISALQFTNHRLAHIAECFWKDGVYVRSHPIPIEADDAGNQPEVEPLFAENDQVGSIYFTSMVPATMYVHNVMVNTTTKIKRTSLAHYYRVLEAISFAGEDITNDLPQFCWFWTWEMERVFVNEQVTETQRQFVQSLIRDAFGNFFPRRFTVTSNSHPSHDPIVTSTFLSRMASSKWPVNSIVPYDACVYPFTFESYSESSHGRARSMVNDRQCPLVSVFDHAFHANPDTSQFTSQEKHTMDTLLLSHTSSIQFLGLIETLQDSCEPIVITDAAGANALLWMKLAAVLVRKPMDFVDCPSNPSSFLVFLDSIALFFSTRQRLLPNLSHSSLGGSARRQPSKTIFTQLSIADTSPSNVDSFFVVSLSNPNTSDLALELLDVLFKTHEFPPSLRNCTITPLQDNSSEPIPTTLSEALLYLFRRIAYKKQQTFPTDSVYLIDSIGNIAVKSRCVIHLNNINTKKVTHRLSHFLFDAPSFVVLNLGWSSLVEIAANYFHPMVKANMWYFALLNKTAQSKLFKEDRNIAITENRNQNSTMAYPNVSPMQSPIRTMIPPDKDVLFVFLHLIVEIFHEASNQKLLNSTDTTIWHIQENNDVVNNIQIPSFSDADFVDFLDCIKQLVSIGLQAYTGTSGKIDSVLIAFETLKMRTELNQQILSDTELFSASQQITGAIDGSLKAIILSIERKQASIIRLEQQLELVKDDYYIDEKGPLHPAHQCSESFLKSMDHLDSITPNAIKSIREAAGFHMTINLLLSCVALLVTVPSVSSFDKSTTNEEILDLMWNVSIVRLSNKIATEVLILFQNEINLDALPSTLPECRRLALWVQEITMLVITASQLDDNDYMQFALHHSNAQTRVTLKRMKVELNSLLNVKSSIEAFTLSNTIQSTPSILRTAKTLLLRAENVILGADQFITELKQESENIKQDTMTLLGDALMSATFYSLGNRFWAPDDSVLDQTTRSLIQDSIIPVSQHVVPLLFPQKLMMFLDMGIETPFNPFVEGEQQPLQIPTPTTAINLNPALNRSGLYPILIPDYQLSWSSPLFIRLADSSRDDTENNFFSESSKKTQQIGVYPQVQNERDPLSKQTYLMYTGSQGFMVDLANQESPGAIIVQTTTISSSDHSHGWSDSQSIALSVRFKSVVTE